MSNFTAKQKELITALNQYFGIAASEISLDESGELFFSLDTLNLLTIKLAPDIQALSISCHSFESELNIVSAHASVTLTDSRHRSCVKSAQVDEVLPMGGKIETLIQAANIADSRAARAVLRAVGFDPVRELQSFLAHEIKSRELDQGSADDGSTRRDRYSKVVVFARPASYRRQLRQGQEERVQ